MTETVESKILIGKASHARALLSTIEQFTSYEEKEAYLKALPENQEFFVNRKGLLDYLNGLSAHGRYLLHALIAIGQGEVIFSGWEEVVDKQGAIDRLFELLYTIDRFYDYLGGVIGYHLKTLELMYSQSVPGSVSSPQTEPETIRLPPCVDIRKESKELAVAISKGLMSLESIAEVYVVGGAGDRLKLVDEKSNIPLPVAALQFCGKSLLHGLVLDLEAREHLYYKLTGKKICVPILLMTSQDKGNDAAIGSICEQEGYFGRPKNTIFRLLQPLAPVLTIDGDWAVHAPLSPVLKPGGHGVIWKLAKDYGAFDWLKGHNKRFCVVRQINNPLAGLDATLLALIGMAIPRHSFGFVTCPRLKGTAEGLIALKTRKTASGDFSYISNIEYTDFKGRIKEDEPYPANTNILFAEIEAILSASKRLGIPGLMVNMKHPVDTWQSGKHVCKQGARLESTMQNISDEIRADKTLVLLNARQKTMSVTKKAFDGTSILETPEGAFYDLLQENLHLLKSHCQFEMPIFRAPFEYIKNGPNALFLYHPALGPLYSIIAQKVTKGVLHSGSELQIEAQEVLIHNVSIAGSLLITAANITGVKDPKTGLRDFGGGVGQLILENVQVKNAGIDPCADNCYWKNRIARKEACRIILEGNSQFVARNITLSGNLSITVKDGMRGVAVQDTGGVLTIVYEPLMEESTFSWRYSIDSENRIQLTR